jgi:hypothetical protein
MNIPEIRLLNKSLDESIELIQRLKNLKTELADIQGMAMSIHEDNFVPENLKLKMRLIADHTKFLRELSESEASEISQKK